MALIVRLLLFIAAPITALFVARDALNFGFIQMIVATLLIAVLAGIVAFWPRKSVPK